MLTLSVDLGVVVVQLSAAPAGLLLYQQGAVAAFRRALRGFHQILLSQEHTRHVVLRDVAHGLGTDHRARLLRQGYGVDGLHLCCG